MYSVLKTNAAYVDANLMAPLGRDTEYNAFAKVTQSLVRSTRDGVGFIDLTVALHENLRLWAIIAQDVAATGNELPAKLRAQLLYLYEFTREHTSKVLAAKAEPDILVEINTSVMRGLRSRRGE